MKEQDKKSNKMILIVIVVVMVCLLVVIGFFSLMYVFAWGGDLGNATDDDMESEKYTTDGTEIPFMDDELKLRVRDAKDSPGEEGTAFNTGEEMLYIEQAGGYPVYWNYLNIEALNTETGDAVELEVLVVRGIDVKNVTEPDDETYMTRTGYILVVGLKHGSDEGVLHSGDNVTVFVYNYYKSRKMFESRETRIM